MYVQRLRTPENYGVHFGNQTYISLTNKYLIKI
jgi:hypothetical protein